MNILMDKQAIANSLEQMADKIAARYTDRNIELALVGIRDRGEVLAQRLHTMLESRLQNSIDLGTLDITLYRDDLNMAGAHTIHVGTTEITFCIDDKVIILVDDVLNTGRSVRAALDALVDLGRPQAIRLAVLIDRGAREYPISADYVGKSVTDVPDEIKVQVLLQEYDETEEVILVEKEY